MSSRRALLPGLLLPLLLACGDAAREVAVVVSIPGPDSVEAPVPGLPVLALPYDRDSVVAALEAAAPSPRPHTRALDSLYREFGGPFAAFARAAGSVERFRDSLAGLRARLDSAPGGGSGGPELRTRVARLTDSLAASRARLEETRAALDRVRRRLAGPIDSLRGAVAEWENTTFRAYDSLVQALVRRSGQRPLSDTTDARGRAAFTLRGDRWWIHARSWDALDPNAEWYWNVPVEGDTVRLSPRTGRLRPRY